MLINHIYNGDCLLVLKEFEENSIDAIVTDPPYGLSFMGKKWDYDVPSVEIWKECLRVLKPGGHLLAFAGTRTQHRMACRIEDAGFEIRDMIAWVYGSGFPKSLSIGKAVDKLLGNEREYITNGNDKNRTKMFGGGLTKPTEVTKGTSPFEGLGTALKPALEPITLARKPISEKSIAENVMKWGTGGIEIDGCRVDVNKDDSNHRNPLNSKSYGTTFGSDKILESNQIQRLMQGRFPANFIHDGSEEVVGMFPETKSGNISGNETITSNGFYNQIKYKNRLNENNVFADSGSASRFFYCAKASPSERNMGLEGMEKRKADSRTPIAAGIFEKMNALQSNFHPTVKPIKLMEYLVKLIARENFTVLDPFAGSGSTLIACKNLNRKFIGIELNSEYVTIAKARLRLPKETWDIIEEEQQEITKPKQLKLF